MIGQERNTMENCAHRGVILICMPMCTGKTTLSRIFKPVALDIDELSVPVSDPAVEKAQEDALNTSSVSAWDHYNSLRFRGVKSELDTFMRARFDDEHTYILANSADQVRFNCERVYYIEPTPWSVIAGRIKQRNGSSKDVRLAMINHWDHDLKYSDTRNKMSFLDLINIMHQSVVAVAAAGKAPTRKEIMNPPPLPISPLTQVMFLDKGSCDRELTSCKDESHSSYHNDMTPDWNEGCHLSLVLASEGHRVRGTFNSMKIDDHVNAFFSHVQAGKELVDMASQNDDLSWSVTMIVKRVVSSARCKSKKEAEYLARVDLIKNLIASGCLFYLARHYTR